MMATSDESMRKLIRDTIRDVGVQDKVTSERTPRCVILSIRYRAFLPTIAALVLQKLYLQRQSSTVLRLGYVGLCGCRSRLRGCSSRMISHTYNPFSQPTHNHFHYL